VSAGRRGTRASGAEGHRRARAPLRHQPPHERRGHGRTLPRSLDVPAPAGAASHGHRPARAEPAPVHLGRLCLGPQRHLRPPPRLRDAELRGRRAAVGVRRRRQRPRAAERRRCRQPAPGPEDAEDAQQGEPHQDEVEEGGAHRRGGGEGRAKIRWGCPARIFEASPVTPVLVKDTIRIASGQGFWGDLQRAPLDQARKGPIDYLVMDYLAEVTMSILQKQRLRDPRAGNARDFVEVVTELLPDIREKGFKVISNAGGVNPTACAEAIVENARQRGVTGLKVAVVTGDDLMDRLDDLLAEGVELKHMETGQPLSEVRDRVVSANAYLGAGPIVEALRQGADVVVTGRTTDTGLTLAPMIYEFDWDPKDWDKMAAGTVAGHILECGAQSSGGNFTDWEAVPNMAEIGFPIVEARPDGTFTVTKHGGTGGLVSTATVSEQLLYEIGDPKDYITPDCVADFTSIHLEQEGENRVRVRGIEGQP